MKTADRMSGGKWIDKSFVIVASEFDQVISEEFRNVFLLLPTLFSGRISLSSVRFSLDFVMLALEVYTMHFRLIFPLDFFFTDM